MHTMHIHLILNSVYTTPAEAWIVRPRSEFSGRLAVVNLVIKYQSKKGDKRHQNGIVSSYKCKA